MIVISGVGIISAIGNNLEEFRNALYEGKSGIRGVKYLDTTHQEALVGEVQLSNNELAERLGIALRAGLSRTVLLGAIALREAVQQARLRENELHTTALVSGTTVANMDCIERSYDGNNPPQIYGDCGKTTEEMAALVGDFAFLSTCSTACSSAANAFILGANLIRSGEYERVVVGGSECLSRFHFNGFRSLQILDSAPCRPFDATRAGLNLGEGAAFFVLEREDVALKRGIEPLALLSGWGNTADAFHQTASSENGEGAYLAMQKALSMSGLTPQQIDYVNAHGTGTINNDASESAALRRVFGEEIPPVSSTKSMTGHTTSVAGAVEMAVCLLALRNHFLPKNLNFENAAEDTIVPITETEFDIPLHHVLCNSFGFGGNDTALILSEYKQESRSTEEITKRPVFLKTVVRYADITPEELPKLPPLVTRRLSGLLRRGLMTSLVALKRVGVEHPDAIIIGTADGCVVETANFLRALHTEGEGCLSPTNFIQSTYNTLSSLISIHTKTHGYNSTYSHGKDSLKSALLDAMLQLQFGDINNALVGLHDEANETALVCVLEAEPTNAITTITNVEDLDRVCGDYSC